MFLPKSEIAEYQFLKAVISRISKDIGDCSAEDKADISLLEVGTVDDVCRILSKVQEIDISLSSVLSTCEARADFIKHKMSLCFIQEPSENPFLMYYFDRHEIARQIHEIQSLYEEGIA
jgi:hypothetical protein